MAAPDINIPGYTIRSELGRGGMATVYLATQESLNRKVAIKVLHSQHDASINERFVKEANFIASLNNPHIITIYDIAKLENGDNYIAMEYLGGGDLDSKVDEYHSPEKALMLVEHIATGLAVVHEKGIIHRDIKPANILFRENGDAVLTDFGIAKELSNDSDLTQAGFSLGSPAYSSPEQAQGKPLNANTDIYSLGVILLELLLGYNVFKGDSHTNTAINHIQMSLPELPTRLDIFQILLGNMLAKDPAERFQTCQALLQDVAEIKKHTLLVEPEEALEAGDSEEYTAMRQVASASSKPLKKINPHQKRIVLAVAVCAVIGVMIFLITYESETDKKIKQLLAQAQLRIENQQFTEPENDNARYYYRQILLLDEDNRKALKGLETVKEAQIEFFTTEGAKAIEESRLDNPKHSNAIYYFQQILVLDENNTAARAGLKQVAEEYLKMAKESLLKEDYRRALKYADRGLKADPEHEMLLATREEIISQTPGAKQKIRSVFNKLRNKIQ